MPRAAKATPTTPTKKTTPAKKATRGAAGPVLEGEVEPKRAPRARKAVAPAPEHTPGPQDTGDDDTGDGRVTAEVTFHGRQVLVRALTADQVTMLRMIGKRLENLPTGEDMPIDKALTYNGQAVRLIIAFLAREDDREWLEGLLIDGELQLADTRPLLTEGMEAIGAKLAAQGTRQERRKAGARRVL